MLILMRDIDGKIIINDDITIKILSVNGRQVRIGIEAPDHINIVRSELLDDNPEPD